MLLKINLDICLFDYVPHEMCECLLWKRKHKMQSISCITWIRWIRSVLNFTTIILYIYIHFHLLLFAAHFAGENCFCSAIAPQFRVRAWWEWLFEHFIYFFINFFSPLLRSTFTFKYCAAGLTISEILDGVFLLRAIWLQTHFYHFVYQSTVERPIRARALITTTKRRSIKPFGEDINELGHKNHGNVSIYTCVSINGNIKVNAAVKIHTKIGRLERKTTHSDFQSIFGSIHRKIVPNPDKK